VTVVACASVPVTPGIVVFDATEFLASYPAFSLVPTAALQVNFGLACLQLQNTCCSVVQDAPTRQGLLYLLTAHITALLNGVNGEMPQGVVGRVSGATEGAVSVQTDFVTKDEAAAFYAQTQWGALYWKSTAQFRAAKYYPAANAASHFSAWDAWPQ
jgi:hypothetical protein